MKVQILIDNIDGEVCNCEGSKVKLCPEWGLAAHIDFNGHKILLDTGASAQFTKNADAMGVDLTKVECGVLSHAHFDHADGLEAFFKANGRAKFYLREGASENCYSTRKFLKFFTRHKYIGIHRGWLERYSHRIEFVGGSANSADSPVEILPGVFLVGHSDAVLNAAGRAAIGKSVGQFVKENGKFRPDSYDHEQSLVFDTSKGLFIMNSCSHGGADNIIKEVMAAFPGKNIYAMLGGFHLFKSPDEKVRAFAERLYELNVQKIYTGHCTGTRAFEILKDVLGDRAEQMHTGMEIEV